MKKYVSVALATAMIASMGVTAFAKSGDQYDADVKDVTFKMTDKTDNGDDELYFPLSIKSGEFRGAYIVDDASGAEGEIADKKAKAEAKKAAYEAAITALQGVTAGDIQVADAVEDADIVAVAEAAVGTLADLTDAQKTAVKADLASLTTADDAAAVKAAIVTAVTAVKTEADAAKTAADLLVTDYGNAQAADFSAITAGSVSDAATLETAIETALSGDVDAANLDELVTAIIAEMGTIADYSTVDENAVATAAAALDDTAATEAAAAAATAATKAASAVTAAGALTIELPEDGAVTAASLTTSLEAVVADDEYQEEIIGMVVANVDLTTNKTPDTVAAAVKALVTTRSANPLHDKVSELTNQISSLGGASYIDYDAIEDIDDLKVSIKLTGGSEYVADYYIDEIDDAGNPMDGCYAIILELNDNYTTKKQKIKGEITLKNKTKKLEEADFTYNHDVVKLTVNEENKGTVNGISGNECEFDGEDVYLNLVDFNETYTVADFKKDVENIELEDNNGFYFDVKASDQGKVNLTYDNVAIKSVARVAPVDADLTFFNFYGYPEFDFTGTVTLTPEEDDVEYFVYKVAKDGKISKVNAKLNDDGDAYEFKTRTLACYVLSDMELDIDDINADGETPSQTPDEGTVAPDEDGKQNPGTGC